jgi:hypothetical protein
VQNIDFGDAERVWEKLSVQKPVADNALADDEDDFFLWRLGAPSALGSSRRGPGRSAPRVKSVAARQLDLFL